MRRRTSTSSFHLFRTSSRTESLDGEIVVVDDSSPDGTGEIVHKFESEYDNVRLFLRPGKLGHGSAIAEGYRNASGNVIFSMDTDFSHDPADIPRFIAKMNEGFDFVQASRYVRVEAMRSSHLKHGRRTLPAGLAMF